METTKPQRRTNMFDYWNVGKKTKITEESNSIRKSLTHFEDLSNEIFYEIFNYLDVYHVYNAFYTQNIRLQNLLTNSNLPLKISISSLSKSTFQRYNRHIIMPNKHRITSLHVTNPFIIDLIFSPVRITSNFTRLETLIFDNIKPKYLVNILSHLASLPNLSSLVIILVGRFGNPNDLYLQIFRLPALKYCKISLTECFENHPLPISINVTSPIEHLVINNNFYLNHLHTLLSYLPYLRRLFICSLIGSHNLQTELSLSKLNDLTYIFLDMITITFGQFESMSKILFNQLQVLRISIRNDRTYLDANQWEQLIVFFMPQLRIFDFQYTHFLENDIDNNQLIYNSVIKQFSSPFWAERKWFFAYQFYWEGYQNQVIFYSMNPYRRKQYTLYKQLIKNIYSHHQRRNVNFIDHVDIRSEESMTSSSQYFRNATKLTLSDSFRESHVWLPVILKRIIPLKQLTTLVIDYDNFCFEQLIKLLGSTPNIHTLKVNCQSITETNSISIQQSEMFRFVSNTNMITNVTIKERYSSENIKLLIVLCSRMQNLTIDICARYVESSLQFILSKNKTNIQQLCLLCMKNTAQSMVGRLKTLIESEELLDNYLVKLIGSELYFWW